MPIPTQATINPLYQPAMRTITAITNANPALVTTSFAHNYVDGTIVRLYIPAYFGMKQADHLFGTVTNNGVNTQFLIDIDTTLFDAFVVPPDIAGKSPWWMNFDANVIPIAEDNDTLQAATHNTLG
jgi:hypothetical protein